MLIDQKTIIRLVCIFYTYIKDTFLETQLQLLYSHKKIKKLLLDYLKYPR